MRQKVIIDTDPGIDDAMAIHLAFAEPSLEVLGLTTVFGNVWVEQATRNALFLTEQAAYPIPVAEGAARPLAIAPNAPSHYVHGEEGFGDMTSITPQGQKDPRPAHHYISETCRAHPHEVVLCPLGPLTNIARLLDEDSEITRLVKKVVIMGGAVDVAGNVTPYAEANIWNDPHAAKRVFEADWPIEMIGLDITEQVKAPPAHFTELAKQAPIIGGFIKDISVFYIKFYEGRNGEAVCIMHDPVAVLSIFAPEFFTYEEIALDVITEGEAIGQTIRADSGDQRKIKVAIGANIDQIVKTYLDIYGKCDTMRLQRGKPKGLKSDEHSDR